MELLTRTLPETGREAYVYYPNTDHRTPFKTSGLTVLMDKGGLCEAQALCDALGLFALADKENILVSFISPGETGWNFTMDRDLPDDVAHFFRMQSYVQNSDDEPPVVNDLGVPLVTTMLRGWHSMNDVRYVVGIGSGASMAMTLAACSPANIAAVAAFGGELCPEAFVRAVYAPMPMYISGCGEAAADYFPRAAQADFCEAVPSGAKFSCSRNPSQTVFLTDDAVSLNKKLMTDIWYGLFALVRRPNSSVYGDVEPRFVLSEAGFDYYIDDTTLSDGKKHTWFVHVPSAYRGVTDKKLPVMFFFHGGSDNPHEAAETSKFHVLGEDEGFITVYPWGTNHATWNSTMELAAEDDVGFVTSLIGFIIKNYPADRERVYMSGFSNGAAMAQTMAMTHPELIAGLCHIDSNWSGAREGFSENGQAQFVPCPQGQRLKETYNPRLPVWYTYYKAQEPYPQIKGFTTRENELFWRDYNITPCIKAMALKEKCDYRMPVWYCYGAREPSYPVFRYSTQQYQYDFWKVYNNIEVAPTAPYEAPDPCGCGVPGHVYERLTPSARHPEHYYDVQRFFSRDESPENYYNYIIMHSKGHEVAHMDPKLGWDYVKHYRRLADGSLKKD